MSANVRKRPDTREFGSRAWHGRVLGEEQSEDRRSLGKLSRARSGSPVPWDPVPVLGEKAAGNWAGVIGGLALLVWCYLVDVTHKEPCTCHTDYMSKNFGVAVSASSHRKAVN